MPKIERGNKKNNRPDKNLLIRATGTTSIYCAVKARLNATIKKGSSTVHSKNIVSPFNMFSIEFLKRLMFYKKTNACIHNFFESTLAYYQRFKMKK